MYDNAEKEITNSDGTNGKVPQRRCQLSFKQQKREEHLKQNEQNNRDLKVLLENEESSNEAGGGEDELKGIRVVISVKDRI